MKVLFFDPINKAFIVQMSFVSFVHPSTKHVTTVQFAPAEFIHDWGSSWSTYWQQYEKLQVLVRNSWRSWSKQISPELWEYLDKIMKGSDEPEESIAWEKIWSWVEERGNILKTIYKLRKMLDAYPLQYPLFARFKLYVNQIDDYIFANDADLKALLETNELLLRFFPDRLKPNHQNGKINAHNPTKDKKYRKELQIRRELQVQNRETGNVVNNGNKLSAIGDLHGDFAATVRVLKNMDIIEVNEQTHRDNVKKMKNNKAGRYEPLNYYAYTWIYGNNMLVQTGDLFDRGSNSREIIELFMWLDVSSGDGQVVNMAGNHEFMQYTYGMSEMDYSYPHYDIRKDSMSFGESESWKTNRDLNLQPGSKYFKWISKLPIVVYEAKSKTVFSHGCIVKKWTDLVNTNLLVSQTWTDVEQAWSDGGVEAMVALLRDKFNNRESPLNAVINGSNSGAFSDIDGPVWNRYYNNAIRTGNMKKFISELEQTVASFAEHDFNVDRLICAHTITNMTGLGSDKECEFKPEQHPVGQTPSVWFIDVGMTEGYGPGKRWGGVELTTTNGITTEKAKHPHCN